MKSILGYIVAFGVAMILYVVLRKAVAWFLEPIDPEARRVWVPIQWLSTAFLWSQWLVQDLANIFVFMPRDLSFNWLLLGLLILIGMQGYIFYQRGGAIQQIVRSKQDVSDIRSATLIDISYGLILFFFKELNDMPMSTTWVFLGLLAGRELAMTLALGSERRIQTWQVIASDAFKAGSGLVISVLLALAGIWMAAS